MRILKSEVEHAVRQLKTNKSPGPNGVYPSEILKLISEENINLLVLMFSAIYDSSKIPQEWLESIFIPLPKSPNGCGELLLNKN